MGQSEKVFLAILMATGLVFFYILSLFFQVPKAAPGPPDTMAGIEELDECEDSDGKKKKYSFTRTQRLKPLGRDQGSFDEDSFRPRQKTPQAPISQRIKGSRSRIQMPLEQRQKQLRENLLGRGYSSPRFLRYQVLGLDNNVYKEAKATVSRLIEQGQFKDALDQLDGILYEVDAENLQVRSGVLEKAIEVSLMSGDLQAFERYSSEYHQVLDETLDIFRTSRLMDFHASRERIYELQKAIQTGKKGSMLQFLRALKSGKATPLEIVTGLKVVTRMGNNSSDSKLKVSDRDLNEATDNAMSLFKNFK